MSPEGKGRLVQGDDYPFNDELLISESDQKEVRRAYPLVHFALDYPELRDYFLPIDARANHAKRRTRRCGFTAVSLVTVALLGASAEALYHGVHALALPIAAAAAIAGLAGSLIGWAGVMSSASKRSWLQDRLGTELVRQFHFRAMLALAPDIVAAVAAKDTSKFLEKRSILFTRFRGDVLERRAGFLDKIVEGDEEIVPFINRPASRPEAFDSPAGRELLSAYERLRIQRQIGFCDYKLSTEARFFSRYPRVQMARFRDAAFAGVVLLLILDMFVLVGVVGGGEPHPLLHIAAVSTAILVLALRTLEEGLQPAREVERYRHYRSSLCNISRKFNAAAVGADRLAQCDALEKLSYDEMVNFLKAGHESKFAI